MWPLRRVLLAGAALRAVLLCWGVWQDAHSRIRYTDIDYDVFTDAARAMAAGGSPVRQCAAQAQRERIRLRRR
jgi:phosphatidylinositol glycan class M